MLCLGSAVRVSASYSIAPTYLHVPRKKTHTGAGAVCVNCGYSDCSPNRDKLLHGLRSEEVVSWGGLTEASYIRPEWRFLSTTPAFDARVRGDLVGISPSHLVQKN